MNELRIEEFINSLDILSVLFWLIPLIVLGVVLKGMALWRAGQNNNMGWFIAMFIFNTMGVLPIIYLLLYKNEREK